MPVCTVQVQLQYQETSGAAMVPLINRLFLIITVTAFISFVMRVPQKVSNYAKHNRTGRNLNQDENNLLKAVPPDIITDILTSFCDGKAISTFYLATFKSNDAGDIVGNTIKQRFHAVSNALQHRDAGRVQELLESLLQQIDILVTKGLEMKKISEQCAILDYFEAQLISIQDGVQHWLIWSGKVERSDIVL